MTQGARGFLTKPEILTAGINLGNPVLAQAGVSATAPKGVSVAIARALAAELGVAIEITSFDHASHAFNAVSRGKVDITFLAIDAERAKQVAFSQPYVVIEGTYLVSNVSLFQSAVDLDSPGRLIASSKGSAYDLHLSRSLKHAKLVDTTGIDQALAMLADGRVDAVAGVRQALDTALQLRRPGAGRVLADRFLEIRQAVCVQKQNAAAVPFIDKVLEKLKASGMLTAALKESGQVAEVYQRSDQPS